MPTPHERQRLSGIICDVIARAYGENTYGDSLKTRLASACGVSYPSFCAYLNGTATFPVQVISRLAAA